ncbi:metallophosphoesterase family protein [Candidatus Parabeggiatoa sp. HSG14]|uniref:metallophosphoesterase family protein n=1 Tax=Candidatus Parabeggiatoa sp. HSG14 TaxID=3055593 RepID=UPI0025A72A0D|nr:metallophosphoesterase family protein [Thiotrichales bacterium HSG14]
MLIGLISDIHANVYGLQAAIRAIQKAKADLIICAGDIVGYYPFVNETIDLLKQEKVFCIKGNHDAILIGEQIVEKSRWHDYMLDYTVKVIKQDNFNWLRKLPLFLDLKLKGLSIEVYHGSPWALLTEYIYPDHNNFQRFSSLTAVDYVILGHTHWPLFYQINKVTIVNPGSCGQPRDYKPGACYALLSTEKRQVSFHRVSYDIERVIDKLQTLKFNQKFIDILQRTH